MPYAALRYVLRFVSALHAWSMSDMPYAALRYVLRFVSALRAGQRPKRGAADV